jgi:hypothetical protein
MNEATDYGNFYWCVKVPKTMSKSGEIYVFADEVQFQLDGSVLFLGYGWDNSVHPHVKTRETLRVNLALAPKSWTGVYAASCMDGHAIAVEHWAGEVVR